MKLSRCDAILYITFMIAAKPASCMYNVRLQLCSLAISYFLVRLANATISNTTMRSCASSIICLIQFLLNQFWNWTVYRCASMAQIVSSICRIWIGFEFVKSFSRKPSSFFESLLHKVAAVYKVAPRTPVACAFQPKPAWFRTLWRRRPCRFCIPVHSCLKPLNEFVIWRLRWRHEQFLLE